MNKFAISIIKIKTKINFYHKRFVNTEIMAESNAE